MEFHKDELLAYKDDVAEKHSSRSKMSMRHGRIMQLPLSQVTTTLQLHCLSLLAASTL